jgi:hypothetical protein
MIKQSNAQTPVVDLGHDLEREARGCKANVASSTITKETHGAQRLSGL